MEPTPVQPGQQPPEDAPGPVRRPPAAVLGGAVLVAAVVVGAGLILANALGPGSSPGPSAAGASSIAGPTPSGSAAPPVLTSVRPKQSPLSQPIASSGSIAIVGRDGSLSLVDNLGQTVLLSDASNAEFGFPTWSPDGRRIAATRAGAADRSIVVFGASRASTGQPIDPIVIFRSPTIGPFYLSWTPDGTGVSFLSDEAGDLSLRLAPADGSAALDGSAPGSRVRTGSPLYYDWIGSDRLLAHIGTGPSAFLGEIGRDGASAAPAVGSPGEFRSAVVSRDRKFIGFVRAGSGGRSEVVVEARDGSTEHAMPVFGIAAIAFDPSRDAIASIGSPVSVATPVGIPVGPLRLLDARSGAIRTLLDGAVVSFWWAPDGKTIAALRVQPVAGSSPGESAGPSPTAPVGSAAAPVPSHPAPTNEVRLVFLDVASGKIRSEPVVDLGQRFIDQVLTFFDQYALSHHIWAPDSSSILLPVVGADGVTSVDVFFPDGRAPVALDGQLGFWSP